METPPRSHVVLLVTLGCCGKEALAASLASRGLAFDLTLDPLVSVSPSSLCAENHFMQFDQCTPCPETQSETYLVMVAILGCVLVAGGMFFALRNVLPMLTVNM